MRGARAASLRMMSMALAWTSNTTGPLPRAFPSATPSRRPPGRWHPVSAWYSPLMPPAGMHGYHQDAE
jgi:hypothetical protein